MNKWKWVVALLFAAVISCSVKAQQYKTALGIRLSSYDAVINNSLSFKHFVSGSTALEALLSFDPVALGILLEKHMPAGTKGLYWFIGGGGYVADSKRRRLGLQGILGLDYKIPSVPLNFSLDWKPEVNLVEDTFLEPAAVGLSIRFTF